MQNEVGTTQVVTVSYRSESEEELQIIHSTKSEDLTVILPSKQQVTFIVDSVDIENIEDDIEDEDTEESMTALSHHSTDATMQLIMHHEGEQVDLIQKNQTTSFILHSMDFQNP